MYTTYFGLKEKPFSIAPDPQYLFMSDRHREALEHLTYGLGDAGGFVLLTGEVGTGKTTVSRCLMDRLPENTQAAFILNPTLSSQELLATICDELKIRYRKTGATLKTLTDKIQDKLLKNHKEGINTLLIIDEAQHLQPEVLEQLRLLTNLETNTKKLLQVILIGQPELQTLLQRRDLRQLAQRITARYHLLPLNKQEVAQYIKHRLSIAEGTRILFSESAVKVIHKICGGIPRLINLVCERSLINAYSSNLAAVNKDIAVVSAYEALGDEHQLPRWWQSQRGKVITIIFMIVFTSVLAFYAGIYKNINVKVNKVPMAADFNNPDQEVLASHTIDNSIELSEDPIQPLKEKSDLNEGKVEATLNELNTDKSSQLTPKISNQKPILVYQDEQLNEKTTKLKNQSFENIQLKNTDGVSDELLKQFKNALKNEDIDDVYSNNFQNSPKEIDPLEKMPLWVQEGLPQLQFEQHIYASDGKGWVKVNGRDRYEGDSIARELILVQILPQKVVLNFRGEKFTMRALSSW